MRGLFPWLELFAPGTWISILSLILIVALLVHSPAVQPAILGLLQGMCILVRGFPWVSGYHSPAMPKKDMDIVRFLVGVPPEIVPVQ